MTALYDRSAFAELTDTPWSEATARAGIEAIVTDAVAAYRGDALWPADDWDSWQTPTPLTTLYVGAAGVIWALDALRRRGLAACSIDLVEAAALTLEAWRHEPDLMRGVELPEPARAGLLCGQTGILAVAFGLQPTPALAQELYERVEENAASTATGVMWGSPGTMLAARAMLDRTGDERWARIWRESASRLVEARDEEGLWTQDLYGERFLGLGPPYGLVGNVSALLRGGELLDNAPALVERAATVLRRAAIREGDEVNWPGSIGSASRGAVPRLQWCSGAPGMVACASSYLDGDLLLAAAETIWRAGPHDDEKGAGLCHGSAGNGYALLKAFERTQDERWLERARAFAVHALEQVARLREVRGQGRYSLWTGDVGVALFVADCLDARPCFPVFDTW